MMSLNEYTASEWPAKHDPERVAICHILDVVIPELEKNGLWPFAYQSENWKKEMTHRIAVRPADIPFGREWPRE